MKPPPFFSYGMTASIKSTIYLVGSRQTQRYNTWTRVFLVFKNYPELLLWYNVVNVQLILSLANLWPVEN